jgi:cytidylate kinase
MSIIVMTREMGTLGKEVAREFGRRKGVSVVHHELVESTDVRRPGDDESEVYRYLEGSEQELNKWRNNRTRGGYLTPEEVLEIGLEGDVLIKGWGATKLLKSIPNVLSVRVCAPMEFRVRTIMERLGVGQQEASREIAKSDAAHGRAFFRFFDDDWRDPLNYDMVLNMAHMSPETCADILCDAVANPAFAETDDTRKRLADELMQSRIAMALNSQIQSKDRRNRIYVSVNDGRARLYGLAADKRALSLAEEIVAAQSGVLGVQNDIAVVNGFSG